ncbi:MAG: hypothetical protein CMO44_17940 [Verrucomicrobiales bacterium]|nr:hypothetical protein [Verrucomicrobiales bacterium]
MFTTFNSEHIRQTVGDITLQYPNDSFFFVGITFNFLLLAVMIIILSSSNSIFLPFMLILISIVFSTLCFLYLLHIAKDWVHLLFSLSNSIYITEDILRKEFSTRLPGGRRKHIVEDDIGDLDEPIRKQDKTLRIDMGRLNTAFKRNLFT